jgi:hypothetical protein
LTWKLVKSSRQDAPPDDAMQRSLGLKMNGAGGIWLPVDVAEKLRADFPREELATLQALLDEYKGNERVRVVRCVVHLAEGKTDRLLHFIGCATTDYRDVILWAEYDRNDQRIRDFNQPFAAERGH